MAAAAGPAGEAAPEGQEAQEAQEVWCLAERRFTAAHRALWHLAHLRQDVRPGSVGLHDEGGVRLVCVKDETLQLVSAASSNLEQEWRITPRTQVSFITGRYHFVFSVDISPSVSVVDTSFQGFSTGIYLLDSLKPCLEDALRLLLRPMRVGGEAFEPALFLTVLAQGCMGSRMGLAVQGMRVTEGNILDVLSTVERELTKLVGQQASWMQAWQESPAQKPGGGARRGGAAAGAVPELGHTWDDACKHNDLNVALRNCLLALSTSEVPDATPAVVLFTDGILWSHNHMMRFDGMLMHLNALDIALHIVQIGGGFAPWSALGMCSDVDLLHFLVSTSPGGKLFQDHHLSHMLREVQDDSDTMVNGLQLAWFWRVSALSMSSLDVSKAYKDKSYLCSLESADKDGAEDKNEKNEQSYIDHLKQLGCKYPPKINLVGLDQDCPSTPSTPKWVTGHKVRHHRSDSITVTPERSRSWPEPDVHHGFVWDDEGNEEEAVYYAPLGSEENRLYRPSSYVLTGVSLVHLLECRAREGFRLLQCRAYPALGEDHHEVQFGLTLRPMFKVFYNAEVCGQEVRVRITTQTPSRDYSQHKGADEHQAQLKAFVDGLRHVDETLKALGDVVPGERWAELQRLDLELQPHVLHHWFSVRRFECLLGDQAPAELHERLAAWASATVVPGRCYWRSLAWGAQPTEPCGPGKCPKPPGVRCQCCAPDGLPPSRLANGCLLPSGPGHSLDFQQSALPPCCVLDVTSVSQESLSVVVGMLGLCPHAEAELLDHVRTEVFSVSPMAVPGFPNLPAGNANASLLGCPGILRALLEMPTPGVGRKTLRGQNPSDDVAMYAPKDRHCTIVDSIGCKAMDNIGHIGGSFFTFSLDWQRLRESVKHWIWRDTFQTAGVAESAFRSVKRLRTLEGWQCTCNTDSMCCYIKRVPIRSDSGERHEENCRQAGVANSTAGGDWAAFSAQDEECAGKFIPIDMDGGIAKKLKGVGPVFHLVEGEGECAFRFKCVDALDGNADSPYVSEGFTADGSVKPLRVDAQSVSRPKDTKPSELDAIIGPVDCAGFSSSKGKDTDSACCTLYYRVHIEGAVVGKRGQRPGYNMTKQEIVTSLWLDAPSGHFDPSLFCAAELQTRGPFCTDLQIMRGSPVELPWTLCPGVAAVRVLASPLHPQWPGPLQLRFLAEDGAAALQLRCGPDEEAEAACDKGFANIARVEARAPHGPVILHGIWLKVVEGASPKLPKPLAEGPTPAAVPVPVLDLAAQLKEELVARDGMALEAVSMLEDMGCKEDAGRGPSEAAAPGPEGHDSFAGLRGLVQSVQRLSSTRLDHANVTPWQHDAFLERVGRLVQRHVKYNGTGRSDGDGLASGESCPDLDKGHYFFTLPGRGHSFFSGYRHAASGECPCTFAMVLVPPADKAILGSLKVKVGDGNVERLRPHLAADPAVALVLSDGSPSKVLAAVDDKGDAGDLCGASKELLARVEHAHWRTCTEAVYHRLCRGAAPPAPELAAAVAACSQASAGLPLAELLAAAEAWPRAAAGAWGALDQALLQALDECGFRRIETCAWPDEGGCSWLCYRRCQAGPEEERPGELCPCFLQVRVVHLVPGGAGRKSGAGLGQTSAEGGTAPRSVGDPRSSATQAAHPSIFQAAFEKGCAEEVVLTAYYLPSEAAWGADSRRFASPFSIHGQRRLRWEGMEAFRAGHSQVAESVLRLSEELSMAVDVAHADLLRIGQPTSTSSVRTVSGLFSRVSNWISPESTQAPWLHSEEILLPLARRHKSKDAHNLLVSELEAMQSSAGQGAAEAPVAPPAETPQRSSKSEAPTLRRLCMVADVKDGATVFVWLSPESAKRDEPISPSPASVADDAGPPASDAGGTAAVSTLQTQDELEVPSVATPADVADALSPAGDDAESGIVASAAQVAEETEPDSRSGSTEEVSAPLEDPIPEDGPPPFWVLVVVPKQPHAQEPVIPVQVQVLYTPMFLRKFLGRAEGPPDPGPLVARCKAALTDVSMRMNQKLLLGQVSTELVLSDLLLYPHLRDSPSTTLGDDEFTPAAFLVQRKKAEEEAQQRKAEEEEGAAPTRDRNPETPAPAPTPGAVVQKPAPAKGGARWRTDGGNKGASSNLPAQDQDDVVMPGVTEDPRFVQLLEAPERLYCPEQGTVILALAPYLHRFRIISWLAGGKAEPVNMHVSAKVTMYNQKNANLVEVRSVLFGMGRLRFRRPEPVWLCWTGLGLPGAGKVGEPHFVRPTYESTPEGGVALRLSFYGLKPLNGEGELKKALEDQLERLACAKLQVSALDSQLKPVLRGPFWEFVRPPGSSPCRSLLLGIPLVESLSTYAQFVRRALLGLMDQWMEEVEGGNAAPEERASVQGGQTSLSFVYKRRPVGQVITDVNRYDQRERQRRDKVSEKVLQFQERIGDGLVYVQLSFVSPSTGRPMDPDAEASAGEGVEEKEVVEAEECRHEPLDSSSIMRQKSGKQAGGVEALDFGRLGAARARSGYLLLDVWHRAITQDQAEKLMRDVHVAVDQALQEYRLQLTLRHAERTLSGTEDAELTQRLRALQGRCTALLENMQDQHLSSLLTHCPPDVKARTSEEDEPARLPLWAFRPCVEGLHKLLVNGVGGPKHDCLVALSDNGGTSPDGEDAVQGEDAADYYQWFDVENKTRSLQLSQLMQRRTGGRVEGPRGPEELLERRSAVQAWSPTFTLMWGPQMGEWQRRLRESLEPNQDEEEDRDAVCAASFAVNVANGLGLPDRLEQYHVGDGGAASLQKYSLEEWRKAGDFIARQQHAAPLLSITLSSSGARIRGVLVDPLLILKVQYFLRSQFFWVSVRERLLRYMCHCELGQLQALPELGFREDLSRHFPWLFDRPRQPQARTRPVPDDRSSVEDRQSCAKDRLFDRASVEESVFSMRVEQLDDASLYLVFGLPRAVAGLAMSSEIVPGRPEQQGDVPAELRAEPSGGPADTQPSVPVARSRFGSAYSSGGQGARRPGHQNSSAPSLGELAARPAVEPSGAPPEVGEVLAGEALLSQAITAAADEGKVCDSTLVDPLATYHKPWLQQADGRMELHQLKLAFQAVLKDWERHGVPIASWAQEALAAHEEREEPDAWLLELAEKLRESLPKQGRASLEDVYVFAAKALLLNLILEYAESLAPPFERLLTGPGLGRGLPSGALHPAASDPRAAPGQPAPEPQACRKGGDWQHTTRSCSLSEKLREAEPVLTVRQRFLSGLLAAFTRRPPGSAAGAPLAGWTLVLCLENPLPWHGSDVLGGGQMQGVLMRPQTLFLHRELDPGRGGALLAEVSCHSDKVRIQVFGQDATLPSAKQAAEEVLQSARDFCFDFQIRSLLDSYNPASPGFSWTVVKALLDGEVWMEVPHQARARNLFIQGDVPGRRLASWLKEDLLLTEREKVLASLGIRPRHLVNFMHATAHTCGFKCAGEAHQPVLALSSLDHRFKHVLTENASASDLHVCKRDEETAGQAAVAQGLRCVLFAQPIAADRAGDGRASLRGSLDGAGELGFTFAAVLVDTAWCTPTCASTTGGVAAAEHDVQWDALAKSLRASAREALEKFAELTLASHIVMRRFQLVYRHPGRVRFREVQEVLASCRSHVDLFADPRTGPALETLKKLPASLWPRLGPYLQASFGTRSCSFFGDLSPWSRDRPFPGDGVGEGSAPGGPLHFFIMTGVGTPQKLLHDEERRYVMLHLIFASQEGHLQDLWLHSSHRLCAGHKELAAQAMPSEEAYALQTFVDDLPSSDEPDGGWQGAVSLGGSAADLADIGAEGDPELSGGSGTVDSIPSMGGGDYVQAVDTLVRRFVAFLLEIALRSPEEWLGSEGRI